MVNGHHSLQSIKINEFSQDDIRTLDAMEILWWNKKKTVDDLFNIVAVMR